VPELPATATMIDAITTTEAGRVADVSSETIRHWSRTGRLQPFIRTRGGLQLFLCSEVQRVAAARREGKCRLENAASANPGANPDARSTSAPVGAGTDATNCSARP
jgi:hypothetical protein